MRYIKPLMACAALLAATAQLQAANLPSSGQDQQVRWQTVADWPVAGKPIDLVHSLIGRNQVYILDEHHEVLVYDEKGRLMGRIPVDEGVTAIDVAPRGEALYLINGKTKHFTTLALDYVVHIDIAGSPFKGKADAPVTIVVFDDFECPYCHQLEPLLEKVFAKNKDKVKLVFKNMPLPFHKMADPAHRAALAAEEQGKFWEFHDRLFKANPNQLSIPFFNSIAKDLGLDMAKFKADMNSTVVRQKINKDEIDAQKAGVTGTPTVFVNGEQLKQRSMEAFQQLIDKALQKSGK